MVMAEQTSPPVDDAFWATTLEPLAAQTDTRERRITQRISVVVIVLAVLIMGTWSLGGLAGLWSPRLTSTEMSSTSSPKNRTIDVSVTLENTGQVPVTVTSLSVANVPGLRVMEQGGPQALDADGSARFTAKLAVTDCSAFATEPEGDDDFGSDDASAATFTGLVAQVQMWNGTSTFEIHDNVNDDYLAEFGYLACH